MSTPNLPKVMSMNATISMLTKLNTLDKQLETASKKKIPDKDWLNLFHEVCGAFRNASAEERVDMQIAFEDRHRLLNQFTAYLNKMAQTAAKTAHQGSQAKTAALIEEGTLADAIIDGRVNMDDLRRAQNLLVEASEKIHFDLNRFIQKFETPANMYVERAYQLHKANEFKQAIQVLGRAIQLNPSLQKNDKIAQLAAELTGEAPRNALMTLEDPFLRNRASSMHGKTRATGVLATARAIPLLQQKKSLQEGRRRVRRVSSLSETLSLSRLA